MPVHHCCFCNAEEEALLHINYLWQQLSTFFESDQPLPALTPQATLSGCLIDKVSHKESLIDHSLLILKSHVCNSRERHCLNINRLLD